MHNLFGTTRYAYERRVGALLRRHPPPVPHARLVGADRRERLLRYEAVPGPVVGPKFPVDLADRDLDAMVGLALAMPSYRPPNARFVRRFDLPRRLARAVETGALDHTVAGRLHTLFHRDRPAIVFGHGDITARNVIRRESDGTLVLIDWEWFGRHPRPWDLAFLWFTLVDRPGGRARVENAIPSCDVVWFWRSALLVQLLHLGLPGLRDGSSFRPRHLATRDALIERVLGEE